MPRKANNEKTTKIERNFGNEREFGEVFKNTETGKISATLNVGFFQKRIVLQEREEDKGYDVVVKDFRAEKDIVVGRTFPNRKKDGTTQEFVQDLTLPLYEEYNKEASKNYKMKNDALYLRIIFLRNEKTLSEKTQKIGFIKGQFGIEEKNEDYQREEKDVF
jgi:hypothetical protein